MAPERIDMGRSSIPYEGRLYHGLIDPLLRPVRSHVVEQIEPHSTVLDIGCGTGELAFTLRTQRLCTVTGIDQSEAMVTYAASRNPYEEVEFLRGDATDLAGFADDHFDVAVIMMVLHEVPGETRRLILGEATRVARACVVLDYAAPLPRDLGGLGARLVERIVGGDHHANFRSFLSEGGLPALLAAAGLDPEQFTPNGWQHLVRIG